MSGTRLLLGRGRAWLATLVVVAGALAAGAAWPGSAEAAWLPAKNVTATPELNATALAVTPDGVATVVWAHWNEPGVLVRRYGPGGKALGPATELSDDGWVRQIEAEPAPDGSVTVAWTHGMTLDVTAIEARRIGPDGEFGETTHTIASNVSNMDLAVAPDGRATLVWEDLTIAPARIALRQITPEETLTGTEHISAAGGTGAEPFVAAAPAGDAAGEVTAAYVRNNGTGFAVHARRLSAAGALDPATYDVSPAPATGDDSGFYPRVGVDAGGTATIIWQQTAPGAGWIRARRLDGDETLSGFTEISAVPGYTARETALEVSPAGDAFIGWAQGAELISTAALRILGADGSLGETISLGPQQGGYFTDDWMDIAATGGSDATLVWMKADAVYGRELIGGKLGPQRELGREFSEMPEVAAGPNGTAAATWFEFDIDGGALRIARSDPSAKPRLAVAAKAPKRVKPGAKFTVKVRVRNRGVVAAQKLKACAKLSRKAKKAFKPLGKKKGCKTKAKLAAGKATVLRLRLKAKKPRAGARYQLGFEVTGRDAESGKKLPKRRAKARVKAAG